MMRGFWAMLCTLLVGGSAMAQERPAPFARTDMIVAAIGNSTGADLKAYADSVLRAVQPKWIELRPAVATDADGNLYVAETENSRVRKVAAGSANGRVELQLAVMPDGRVTKIVFVAKSGIAALDSAAAGAIVDSNPLPPLPAEFKGDRIVLEIGFLYGVK